MTVEAIRCRIVHVDSVQPLKWTYLDDGIVLIGSGKIEDIGPATRFEQEGFDLSVCDWRPDELLMPGFIDTHVHSPQIDVIGSCGEQLLDWLNRYTFPAEARFADVAYAEQAASDFLDGLLKAGTTSAMIFVTSHLQATEALFRAAAIRNMRLIAGKVLMDQNAPAELLDTAEQGTADSKTLIETWHGKGRLGYAITPRFAGSSSAAQLAAAGKLHEEYPDTWIQTHLSENLAEIEWVAELHPERSDYLNVYEHHGLLTDKSVFGHCIHLSEGEIDRMASAGGKVAFCPSSNLFLGSGLLDVKQLEEHGVVVSLATDVGAGTSLSMWRTMGDAYKVCQLRGHSFSAMEAFAMSTLGNAEALGLEESIGNLAVGKEADFICVKALPGSLLERRVDQVDSIEEELFVYMTLADESVISRTFIEGKCLWETC